MFSGCEDLTEIKIPDGVVKIGGGAFASCKKLTTINIPDSVTEIGAKAFSRCEKLAKIKIPDGVTRLEEGVFQDCFLLEDIIFPKNIEFLGSTTLDRTKWLTEHPDGPVIVGGYLIGYNGTLPDGSEITIPTEVRRIARGVFSNLIVKDLVVTIPDGIILEDGAFRYSSIKAVRLPADLTCVPDNAFYSCNKLEHISLPESVTEIGDSAFYGCKALNEIELPSKLKKIGRDAFARCNNLTVLNIPESVTSFGATTLTTYITKIILSAELAATAPKFPTTCGIYIRCTPDEAECDYEQLYKEKYKADYNIYLYVQDEQDLPVGDGNYWHYDEDGKTPVIWQV